MIKGLSWFSTLRLSEEISPPFIQSHQRLSNFNAFSHQNVGVFNPVVACYPKHHVGFLLIYPFAFVVTGKCFFELAFMGGKPHCYLSRQEDNGAVASASEWQKGLK